ncbi:hypothetical protein LCM10_03240 [Rossellomorea aquimaris]|uniref:hypothetical protein n=1 Tax=Rossellomorea aquimaris TaxID=189382 RepID=UPI001CD47C0A|nr:hypothetical protein [Rossellomorea aquimaris]MCA1053990.1 hypothetical protein [Rossellomorea aquimaris]
MENIIGLLSLFPIIWICSFLIARMLSPFGKTQVRNELKITCIQSILISLLIVFMN